MIYLPDDYVMTCAMWLCMYVENGERPCELTHPVHLQMIFHRKELNPTKSEWFLMQLIFMLVKLKADVYM